MRKRRVEKSSAFVSVVAAAAFASQFIHLHVLYKGADEYADDDADDEELSLIHI